MDEIVLLSLAIKIGFLFAGAELALLYLGRLDRRLGIDWKKDIAPLLERDARAAAQYFGLRFAAVFVGLALLIS
jgi:hypothetical protein